jgi:hypothetical protein
VNTGQLSFGDGSKLTVLGKLRVIKRLTDAQQPLRLCREALLLAWAGLLV